MLTEYLSGERLGAGGSRSDGRSGAYSELICNRPGVGRYFEIARNQRLFTLATAANATLTIGTIGNGPSATMAWGLLNPPGNNFAAVILKASMMIISGASSTPVIPGWEFTTNLTGATTFGGQTSTSAILGLSGPGTMRSFINQAMTGAAGTDRFIRLWAGNYEDPRHLSAVSETGAGVFVEETDGSIIVPPGVILYVKANTSGVALTGCISVLYAEIDWPL